MSTAPGTTPPTAGPAMGSELERANALSAAQWAWRALLVIPLVAFAAIVYSLAPATTDTSPLGLALLVIALLWLALIVPTAYVLRSHCFRAAWRGRPIDPESYIRGLITVWLSLEVVTLLSLAACVVSKALLPGVLPGTLALILLAMSGPSPKALGIDEAA